MRARPGSVPSAVSAHIWSVLVLLMMGLWLVPVRMAQAQELLVTFHGGGSSSAGSQGSSVNTVLRYSLDGKSLGSALTPAAQAGLRELRGMSLLPDGSLLVANAYKDDSRLVQFSTCNAQGQRDLLGNFSAYRPLANGGLVHPYGVAVGPDGTVYVSTQDTGVVLRYYGAETPDAFGQPHVMPPAIVSRLQQDGADFYPGTHASFAPAAELRGIAVASTGELYVAYLQDNVVVRIEANGSAGAQIDVDAPHALLLDEPGQRLLVSTDAGPVIVLSIPDLRPVGKFADASVSHSCGMALLNNRLYVLAQTQQTLVWFDATSGSFGGVLAWLPDAPEQLMVAAC